MLFDYYYCYYYIHLLIHCAFVIYQDSRLRAQRLESSQTARRAELKQLSASAANTAVAPTAAMKERMGGGDEPTAMKERGALKTTTVSVDTFMNRSKAFEDKRHMRLEELKSSAEQEMAVNKRNMKPISQADVGEFLKRFVIPIIILQ